MSAVGHTRPGEAGVCEVALAEYDKLKDEQIHRIGARDNLTYATLAVVAAAVAGVLQAGRPALLLAVPPVCLVLGWTRLTNDAKVTAIGRYIRDDLNARLGAGSVMFGWEAHHRRGSGRRLRKALQLGMDLLTFAGPGVAAVAAVLTDRRAMTGLHRWLVPLVTLDVATIAVLAWQQVVHADLTTDPSTDPTTDRGTVRAGDAR